MGTCLVTALFRWFLTRLFLLLFIIVPVVPIVPIVPVIPIIVPIIVSIIVPIILPGVLGVIGLLLFGTLLQVVLIAILFGSRTHRSNLILSKP